ncbi:MAG: hypothetical protein ETSY1_15585 [Candidatus Entotheonella factor]|uniref:Peptidase S8/S53 domain-containing protein n=1 Tax=Entotheonella factor TaxID=1429438 RepID=W4LNL3_ENTF1|nr:MAG: hypothetical protein ETSY1_15585 [Candidatus Entotheonella factor]
MKLTMRITWIIALLAWPLLMAGCSGQTAQPPRLTPATEGVPKQLLERQVIITLTSDAKAEWDRTTASLVQTYDLPQVGAFPLSSIGVQCVVFQVPSDRSLPELIARLEADPRVESVQPNQFFQGQGLPYNDQYAQHQYGAQAVRAALVHPHATGRGVKVAVIDTGVDTTHPDLQGRIVTMANFVAGGKASFDRDRHGTAIAGVIAAKANNDIGIFGVAPEADLMALKACWHGSGTSQSALCSSWTLARAVDFALQEGARILNLSLAGPTDPLLDRLLRQALSQDVIAVAATLPPQRQRGDIGFPASLDHVIAVVSSDPQGHARRPASAADNTVLAAPGVDILTTTPQQTYDFLSGSSLAAAHVSGIAALLLEDHPSPTPVRVRALLQATSRPARNAGAPPSATLGIVDACAALRRLESVSSCPAS